MFSTNCWFLTSGIVVCQSSKTSSVCSEPVFRIHDILGWIRIRGSMPLTNGSGSRSCFFRHGPSRCQQKTNFWHYFFCILLFEGTFTSLFKDKKSKRSHKCHNSRNQSFSYYFCLMIEWSGSRSIPLWLMDPGPGGLKTSRSGFVSGSATLPVTVKRFSVFICPVYILQVQWGSGAAQRAA